MRNSLCLPSGKIERNRRRDHGADRSLARDPAPRSHAFDGIEMKSEIALLGYLA